MAVDASFYTSKRSTSLYASIWACVVTIILTAWLYLYNTSLASQNEETKNDIAYVDWVIKEVKQDRSVQIYDLVRINQKALWELSRKSNMKTHVEKIANVWAKYGIYFEWFNYSNGEITTQIKAVTADTGDQAYAKVVNFINLYRKDEERYFDLWFINTVAGSDSMIANIKLNVK